MSNFKPPANDKKRALTAGTVQALKNPSSQEITPYYSTNITKCQENAEKELSESFKPRKTLSEYLAESYFRLGYLKESQRVYECSSYLAFSHAVFEDYTLDANSKLHRANFCRDRLCPTCLWRRSLKYFNQASKILSVLEKDHEFLFLTLTAPNCAPEDLSETIDKFMKGWDRLTKRKRYKDAVYGYSRALEVTINRENNTYHPHFHCVLAVKPSYFTSRCYISQAEWLQLWRDTYGDQNITQVDVRKAYAKPSAGGASVPLGSVVAEAVKYSTKPTEYIIPNDPDETDRAVATLKPSLHKRRLIQYGGCFKDVARRLKLDDPEEGDLLHVETDVHPAIAHFITHYSWGLGCYRITGAEFLSLDAKAFIPGATDGSIIYRDLSENISPPDPDHD